MRKIAIIFCYLAAIYGGLALVNGWAGEIVSVTIIVLNLLNIKELSKKL